MPFGRTQNNQAGLSFGSASALALALAPAFVIALAAFVLLCAPMLNASAPAQSWGLAQLMASMAEVRESRARFSEEKHLSLLTEPLRLTGTLRYVRPDQLEKSVTHPDIESLRVNGDRVEWQRQKRTRTLSLRSQPQIWALVDSIRATLAGDLPSLNQHYWVKFEGDRNRWKINLEPRQDTVSQFISSIRLEGSANQLRRVEIIEANNDSAVMHIEEDRH